VSSEASRRSGRRGTWRRPCITREKQAKKAFQLLSRQGRNAGNSAAMKRDLEAALIDMAEAHALYEEYEIKRAEADRARRRLVAKLQRARVNYSTEVALTLNIDGLIEEMSRERKYAVSVGEKHIRIWSGHHSADVAIKLALRLLRIHGVPSRRKGREELAAILPATTRTGAWCKLAAILYGDPKANLFARVQKAAKKEREQIRYFLKQKKPQSNI
jgi:hypothetical protein